MLERCRLSPPSGPYQTASGHQQKFHQPWPMCDQRSSLTFHMSSTLRSVHQLHPFPSFLSVVFLSQPSWLNLEMSVGRLWLPRLLLSWSQCCMSSHENPSTLRNAEREHFTSQHRSLSSDFRQHPIQFFCVSRSVSRRCPCFLDYVPLTQTGLSPGLQLNLVSDVTVHYVWGEQDACWWTASICGQTFDHRPTAPDSIKPV